MLGITIELGLGITIELGLGLTIELGLGCVGARDNDRVRVRVRWC